MAVGMGFADVRDLFARADRIVGALDARRPLSLWDWSRTLLASEIVFASNVMGSGTDWADTTGLDDARSLQVLRSLQRKLAGTLVSIGHRG